MNRLKIYLVLILCSGSLILSAQTFDFLCDKGQENAFPVVQNGVAANIFVDENEAELARIVADDLSEDIFRVTAIKSDVVKNINAETENVIVLATVEKSIFVKDLVKSGKIDVQQLHNKYESYQIQIVRNPTKKIKNVLLIIGSDRRGLAYGVYELSRQMGVSPWYWWADVPVQKRAEIFVKDDLFQSDQPSVRYRGVFLNDEIWGLKPWAENTIDTAYNTVGPNAYAKIFELLLRLKANYIWPIKSSGFNNIPENAEVADKYGIVRGSAHNAPMLGNPRKEWDEETMGEWNYITNRENIRSFWSEKVKNHDNYENVYTMGMRGVGDLAMEGGKTMQEKVNILEQIIEDQRQILSSQIDKDIAEIPQVLTAYKEVLELYKHGLKIPEDITIVWPDDNYGYIKRLPNHAEQQRKGGSGVYYHLSYLGRPHDYLWLCTTSPWLIYEEMKKAWDFNAREIWVFNVGDIKPAEYELSFCMDMAYDINSVTYETIGNHLENWYVEKFGETTGKKAAMLKKEYYRLAFTRKPEYMGWDRLEPKTPLNDTEFSFINYMEAEKRLDAYQKIKKDVADLYAMIPEDERPAFHQLVYYPVTGAALMNQKHLLAQQNRWYARQGRVLTNELAQKAHDAHDSILLISEQYESWKNEKWKIMASYDWMVAFPVYQMHPVDYIKPLKTADWDIWVEGMDETLYSEYILPQFIGLYPQKHFFDIYNKSTQTQDWEIETDEDWIITSAKKGKLLKQKRIFVEVDWDKISDNQLETGFVRVKSEEKQITVKVLAFTPENTDEIAGLFVEDNGVVVINASSFHDKLEKDGYSWQVYDQLGTSGKLISTVPVTSPPMDHEWDVEDNAPYVAYDFYTFSRGWFDIRSLVLPTHPINNNRPALYGISIDDQPPLIVDFSTAYRSEEWKQNVVRNASIKTTKHYIETPGKHRLKIWQLAPGTYFDKFILDFGGLQKSYLGPEEQSSF